MLGVFALALLVRLVWVPDLGAYADERRLRQIFDGHERALAAVLEGAVVPDPSAQHHPVVSLGVAALAHLTADPRALLGVAALAGSCAALAALVAVGRWFGPAAGLWAGIFVALLPEHAAWSTSLYPVGFGTAALVGAFAVRSHGGAAALLALACLLRPELVVLAPFRGRPAWGALVGAAGFAVWLGGPPGDWSQLAAVWPANLQLVGFLGPPVLALGLLGLGAPRAGALLAMAVVSFGTAAAFDDAGPRHVLAGGVALACLAGVAAQRQGVVLGLLIAGGLAFAVQERAAVWVRPTDLSAEAAGLPAPDPACLVVSDEPVLVGQPEPSHWTLWTGEAPPCVLWGEEGAHRAWSSRGLSARARRMRALYDPTPAAAVRVPGGWRVYHRLRPPEPR